MPGGLLQLAAYGAQDLFLTGNPQMSFFITVYKRHTNFAIESINQPFMSDPGFGKKTHCIIDRIGDLITQVFVEIKIPNLIDLEKEFDDSEQLVGWVNDLGYSLIDYVDIEIGGTVIDKQYGIWMGIWYELTTPVGKRTTGDILIGKDNIASNQPNSRNKAYSLYVPLYFWFCRHEGLALPLIALQYHEVRINISFKKLDDLWQSLNGKFNQELCSRICNKKYDIQEASLYIDYIFLENEERKLFVKRKHNYLIEQVQINTESFNTQQTDVIVNLNFSHPVKELMWVIQNEDVIKKNENNTINVKGNEWFNFSDRSYSSTNGAGGGDLPTDPMIDCELQFEGKPRFDKRDSQFFRLVQPFQRHSNCPNSFVYIYSFALHPEDLQPSGTCNFSRIDNVNMVMKLAKNKNENIYLNNPTITVYATNYNVLQIANGMAGLAYVN